MKMCRKVSAFPCSGGFTLVELLIVIGIIAVLSGVLLASFGGATESARAAKCLTNMRALAAAANARAIQTGYYPSAGSVELETWLTGGSKFVSQAGWISWLCRGNYDNGEGDAVATAHRSNPIFPYYGKDNDDDNSFALTNGTIWTYCNRNKDLYVCPEHVRQRRQKNQASIHFSYVMNARFGWDRTKGSGSIKADYVGIEYGTLTRADKFLMFAELALGSTADSTQGEEEDESATSKRELKADCVLQYLQIGSDTSSYASEGSDAESIGFVHKASKGKKCAHVVFADGHTEKLMWISGGLEAEKVTAYLCRGLDLTVDPSAGWSLAKGVED